MGSTLMARSSLVKRAVIAILVFFSAGLTASEQARVKGDFVQGGLLQGEVAPGTQIFIGEQEVRTNSTGHFIIGLDRDAEATLSLRLVAPDGQEYTQEFAIQPRDYNIQRVEGISKKIMQPSQANIDRSRAEAALVRAARKVDSDREDFVEGFQWPAIGPITGVFGSQRVYNGVPKRPHFGVDVAGPVGTPVVAPAGGKVTLAHDDMFYSGGTLIIDHGYGLSSSFLHLSEIVVEEGDEVKPGQLIAKMGASGRATGPHLDWRMNWYKQRIDPQLLVGPMPKEAQGKSGSENTGGTND